MCDAPHTSWNCSLLLQWEMIHNVVNTTALTIYFLAFFFFFSMRHLTGLAYCASWGRKETDTTERVNWAELNWTLILYMSFTNFYFSNTIWLEFSAPLAQLIICFFLKHPVSLNNGAPHSPDSPSLSLWLLPLNFLFGSAFLKWSPNAGTPQSLIIV